MMTFNGWIVLVFYKKELKLSSLRGFNYSVEPKQVTKTGLICRKLVLSRIRMKRMYNNN